MPSAVLSPERELLSRKPAPDTEFLVWERRVPSAMADWIDALPPDCIPSGRFLLEPGEVTGVLSGLMEETGTARGHAADLFIGDVATLASLFARLMEVLAVDLRLERIDGDACWKFHCDNVPFRLLCTYRGAGTQYVPARHRDEALRLQRAYAGPLVQFPRFSAALLRGSLLSDRQGALHRSPPLSAGAETRLLLCLNVPSVTSPPRWTGSRT